MPEWPYMVGALLLLQIVLWVLWVSQPDSAGAGMAGWFGLLWRDGFGGEDVASERRRRLWVLVLAAVGSVVVAALVLMFTP
ncbi:MAG: hypothetical protein KTR31_31540 [Myxococcales bacterium]|nr:hypothetical protein [Myxococcales bacterium]